MERQITINGNRETVHFVNPSDYDEGFWGHNYLVRLTAQGIAYAVNASCEQDAIDFVIDYCEEHHPGLLLDDDAVAELDKEGFLDEYISGGNHGRHLSTHTVSIKGTNRLV